MLRDAGIGVDIGVLRDEGERVLEAYLMRQRMKRPHVTLKLAVSADGMIGRKGEGQLRITGAVSRAQVQVLRAETDAILVGAGTANADDPELTVRLPGLEARSPIRIVLDRRLDLTVESKLVRSAGAVPLIAVASCCTTGRRLLAQTASDPHLVGRPYPPGFRSSERPVTAMIFSTITKEIPDVHRHNHRYRHRGEGHGAPGRHQASRRHQL
jgi:hypothetical protein